MAWRVLRSIRTLVSFFDRSCDRGYAAPMILWSLPVAFWLSCLCFARTCSSYIPLTRSCARHLQCFITSCPYPGPPQPRLIFTTVRTVPAAEATHDMLLWSRPRLSVSRISLESSWRQCVKLLSKKRNQWVNLKLRPFWQHSTCLHISATKPGIGASWNYLTNGCQCSTRNGNAPNNFSRAKMDNINKATKVLVPIFLDNTPISSFPARLWHCNAPPHHLCWCPESWLKQHCKETFHKMFCELIVAGCLPPGQLLPLEGRLLPHVLKQSASHSTRISKKDEKTSACKNCAVIDEDVAGLSAAAIACGSCAPIAWYGKTNRCLLKLHRLQASSPVFKMITPSEKGKSWCDSLRSCQICCGLVQQCCTFLFTRAALATACVKLDALFAWRG